MRRGTTPTLPLIVDADIADWTVYASFKTNGEVYTFNNDRMQMTVEDDVTTILLTLTQEETLAMHGSAEVQVRAIKNGNAIATEVKRVDVGRIIKEGVIHEML